jgi:hypothetical protein
MTILAKLEGTELVEQFSIAKARDMEISFHQAFVNKVKEYEQDREVIQEKY